MLAASRGSQADLQWHGSQVGRAGAQGAPQPGPQAQEDRSLKGTAPRKGQFERDKLVGKTDDWSLTGGGPGGAFHQMEAAESDTVLLTGVLSGTSGS